MSDIGDIYKAEILRAVFGPRAHEGKVHDMHRLTRLAERLADTEEAQRVLRAKGYGATGMTLLEIICSVPSEAGSMLRNLFRRTGATPASGRPADTSPSPAEVHDIWSTR